MANLSQFFRREFSSVRGAAWCAALCGVALGTLVFTAGTPTNAYALPVVSGLWSALLAVLVWRAASRRAIVRYGSTEVFDALPNAIVVCKPDLDIVACNATTARLFGRSESSLIGESLDSILMATHELLAMVGRRASENGKLRMTGVLADHSAPDLEVAWSRYEQAGEPRILMVISHVSAQLRRQQIYQFLLEGTALSLGKTFSPTLCRRLSEAFRVPIAFIGKFENEATAEISLLSLCRNGRLQHSAAPRQMDIPWRTLMPGGHLVAAQNFAAQVRDSAWVERNDVESCVAVAIRNDSGDTIGVLGMMDDLPWSNGIDDAAILSIFAARAALEMQESQRYDEIESAQIQAACATRNKTSLLNSVSHEIRTLLTSVMGFADYLESTGGDTRQRELAVDAIKRSGYQLMAVVENAQSAADEEVVETDTAKETCAPQDILAKAVAAFRGVADEKGVKLHPRVDDSAPATLATDPDAIHRILSSMLEFAATRSVDNRIELCVELDGKNVEFSVSDYGDSISLEELSALFKARPADASGVDLPEAQHQARIVGGVIDAESRDDGITLRLSIPTTTDDELTVNLPSRFLTNRRMLLVEDGPDNRQLLQFLLEDEGASVELAENGKEGVQMAETAEKRGQPFDMVLMDMQMPIMDGHEATRRLKSHGYPRPIIAVTANAESSDRERAMLAGCDEYVSKPVDRDELMVRIHLCLEEQRLSAPADFAP